MIPSCQRVGITGSGAFFLPRGSLVARGWHEGSRLDLWCFLRDPWHASTESLKRNRSFRFLAGSFFSSPKGPKTSKDPVKPGHLLYTSLSICLMINSDKMRSLTCRDL